MDQQVDEKSNQKSCQNGPKINEKSIKNWSKSRSGGVLGHIGASCGIFGCLEGTQDGQKTPQNASWGVLARKRWPTWLQLGSQNGAKIEKKSKPNAIKIWMPLGVGFLKDFGGFGRAKWSQVGIRIASQIDPNFERRFCEKRCFSFRKNNDIEGSGAQSWE